MHKVSRINNCLYERVKDDRILCWFKYYASDYTGATALIYRTYLEGALLIQDGTRMGTFEKPYAGLRRLILFAPKTIKEKLRATETESKPVKTPELHARRRVFWSELNNDRDYYIDIKYITKEFPLRVTKEPENKKSNNGRKLFIDVGKTLEGGDTPFSNETA